MFVPTLVSAKAPLTMPTRLRSPVPPMDAAEPSATVPLSDAAVALLLINAPALLMPVPLKLRLLVMLWPLRSSTAPLLTDAAPVPSAVLLPACSVPALTMLPPP